MGLLERAGLGQQSRPGRHPIDILTAQVRQDEEVASAAMLLAALAIRVSDAVEVLRSSSPDSMVRADALAILTGVEL
jgi:hypothetical protein